MKIIPITFKDSCLFVKENHRHNKPPQGHKFSIGLIDDDKNLIGVGMAGRPIARAFDNGFTLEVIRTCTLGDSNANSMIYGAIWKIAKAMGYTRCITYTQHDESGSSLKGAGWIKVKDLPSRKSWAESSVKLKDKKDPVGSGGVSRTLWEIKVLQEY